MTLRRGFSLTELLVVVAILAILSVFLFNAIGNKRGLADDAKAKGDLDRLKISFEEYYNDHNCYPPAAWFDEADDCNSGNLKPYLNNIPCDKRTGLPYVLETDDTTCKTFKFYTFLKFPEADERVVALCDNVSGSTLGNYGVSSTNTNVTIMCQSGSPTPTPSTSVTPTPTPSISPTPTPSAAPEGSYYCSSINVCTGYNNAVWTCDPDYFTSNCDGACATTTGSCIHD